MKNKIILLLTVIIKGCAIVGGFAASPAMSLIPAKYMVYAALVFGLASWLKDGATFVGDFLDDGKLNKSFKGLGVLLLAGSILTWLVSCGTAPNGDRTFGGLTGSEWLGVGGMTAKAAAPAAWSAFVEKRASKKAAVTSAKETQEVNPVVLETQAAAVSSPTAGTSLPSYLQYGDN